MDHITTYEREDYSTNEELMKKATKDFDKCVKRFLGIAIISTSLAIPGAAYFGDMKTESSNPAALTNYYKARESLERLTNEDYARKPLSYVPISARDDYEAIFGNKAKNLDNLIITMEDDIQHMEQQDYVVQEKELNQKRSKSVAMVGMAYFASWLLNIAYLRDGIKRRNKSFKKIYGMDA